MATTAKRIMVYVTPDEQESLFDLVVAHDLAADVVLPYTRVSVENVADIVYDAVFARKPSDLKNLVFFVGGSGLAESTALIEEIKMVLEKLPEKIRVSVAADPGGAYTTGTSIVAKVKKTLGSLDGVEVLVLAATGPIGMACSALFGLEGARARLSSRLLDSAQKSCGFIKGEYGSVVKPIEVKDEDSLASAIDSINVVVACGPPGVQLVSRRVWESIGSLRVLVDANAVAPSGIDGVEADFDGVVISGRTCFGALGLGELKMRVHNKLVGDLFREKGVVYDLKSVYGLAERLV